MKKLFIVMLAMLSASTTLPHRGYGYGGYHRGGGYYHRGGGFGGGFFAGAATTGLIAAAASSSRRSVDPEVQDNAARRREINKQLREARRTLRSMTRTDASSSEISEQRKLIADLQEELRSI